MKHSYFPKKFRIMPVVILILMSINIQSFAASGGKNNNQLSTPGGNMISSISGGSAFTIVLKSDGTVWTWGHNMYGQLGDGSTTNSSTPVQVIGLSGVTAIAAGYTHAVALKSDGTVWTWGRNDYGQLGDGSTTNSSTPLQVTGLSGVVAIAGGWKNTVVLKSDGTVWAWGQNNSGQLGDGSTTNSSTPVQVSGLTGVAAISAGGSHTAAILSDGTVWTWGQNNVGQLGDGYTTNSSSPIQVSGLSGATAVSAGDSHTAVLLSDGTVYTWGSNTYGQLGDGTTNNSSSPIQVSGLSGVAAVSAGPYDSMVLLSDGTVWIWGYNAFGQLGDGTTNDSSSPIQVNSLSGITEITIGYGHVMASQSDGTLWIWGRNYNGQLGDGTTTDSYYPLKVTGMTVHVNPGQGSSETKVASLSIQDSSNYGNAKDIQVAFTAPNDESKIKEYRVYVVASGTLDKDGALAITQKDRYKLENKSRIKTIKKHVVTLTAAQKDTTGAAISGIGQYKVYVLSVGRLPSATSISEVSNTITLSPTSPSVGKVLTITPKDTGSINNETDLTVVFNKAENETPIKEYKIFIVPSGTSFDTDIAKTKSEDISHPERYFKIAALNRSTTKTYTAKFSMGTKNSEGGTIQNGVDYEVYILSVPKNTKVNYYNLSNAASIRLQ